MPAICFVLLAIVYIATFPVKAEQEKIVPLFPEWENLPPSWIDDTLAMLASEEDKQQNPNAFNYSVLPAIYFTPEKGLTGGAMLAALYPGKYPKVKMSSLFVTAIASIKGAYGVEVEHFHYFDNGKDRVDWILKGDSEPAVFYGIGMEDGDDSKNRYDYNHKLYRFEPTWQRLISNQLYFGLGVKYQHVEGETLPIERALQLFPSQESYGITLSLALDERNNEMNPTKGRFANLEVNFNRNDNRSSDYQLIKAEYSNFHNLAPSPGLIAWQIKGQFSGGDVPWYDLPSLGGSRMLRGYVKGRYRDRQLLMAQVEYRLPLFQRYGMVVWAGTGTLSDNILDLGKRWLNAIGTGARFRLKDKINVRADLGIGKNEALIYLNIKEAF